MFLDWLPGIPLKIKLYALVALAFILALLRWRATAVDDALEDVRAEQEAARLRGALLVKEIEHDIDNQTDSGLRGRASRWVRPKDGD